MVTELTEGPDRPTGIVPVCVIGEMGVVRKIHPGRADACARGGPHRAATTPECRCTCNEPAGSGAATSVLGPGMGEAACRPAQSCSGTWTRRRRPDYQRELADRGRVAGSSNDRAFAVPVHRRGPFPAPGETASAWPASSPGAGGQLAQHEAPQDEDQPVRRNGPELRTTCSRGDSWSAEVPAEDSAGRAARATRTGCSSPHEPPSDPPPEPPLIRPPDFATWSATDPGDVSMSAGPDRRREAG